VVVPITSKNANNITGTGADVRKVYFLEVKEVGGKLPPVGNTVDLTTAKYANTIGAPELIGWFKDPAFDPKQKAFYYLRVLEIPTPRWTLYDAVKYGDKMTPDVPMVQQERAITSAIWYNPA